VLRFLAGVAVAQRVDVATISVRPALDLHLIAVVLGLVILVIAYAFEIGVRLQRDQDLTV
jgi:hypothetical protein